ncbi:hypothetical protein OTU49_002555 [Cherax quadricarinatus]|uniref:Uncharacterized protein n=1 Tax=Cherax quadricarinatus TaxID=27406 RepID=A0AAW0XPJ2_CHEQU
MWYKFGGKDSDFDNDSEFGSEEEELECGLYAQLYFESNPDYHGDVNYLSCHKRIKRGSFTMMKHIHKILVYDLVCLLTRLLSALQQRLVLLFLLWQIIRQMEKYRKILQLVPHLAKLLQYQ